LARGYNKEPYSIRRLLTEGAAKASDKRAVFVGAEAYEAAGGVIARDLFQHDGGGWFEDVALLDRLARERLEAVAAEIRSEGWKWLEVALDFPYGHTTGLRRVAPAAEAVSAADQAAYDALRREYDELEAEYEGAEELPDAVDARLGELEQALARFGRGPREADRGRPYACSAIQTGLEDRWHRPPPQPSSQGSCLQSQEPGSMLCSLFRVRLPR
jgi:ParB family chromosome partitioning protein